MYSVVSTIFVIGCFLIFAGFLGRIGTAGISNVSANVAASLGLLIVYAFWILSISSFSELFTIFEGICGGIPYLSEIADYGSLQKLFSESPLSAAVAFMDTVILSAMIDIIELLPLTRGGAVKKFMVDLFTRSVIVIISLLLLNYFVKETSAYRWVVSAIGSAITLVSVGTIPALIVSQFKKNSLTGMVLIGIFLQFSKSKIAGILRASFLKAIIYVIGIWMLEKHFGDIANGLSQLQMAAVVLGPIVIMIIGLVIILKSALA